MHYATFELAEFLKQNFEQLEPKQILTALTCLAKQHVDVHAHFVTIGKERIEKCLIDLLKQGDVINLFKATEILKWNSKKFLNEHVAPLIISELKKY